MFKTPITKKAIDKVQQCETDTVCAQQRVKGLNESVTNQQNNIDSPLLLVVGSYAAGFFVGSQLSSARKADAGTMTVKPAAALLVPLVGKVVAFLTARQKLKRTTLEQADENSDVSEPEAKTLHS